MFDKHNFGTKTRAIHTLEVSWLRELDKNLISHELINL